jgi:hypothetical protein
VFVDDRTGDPTWVTVKTGWFGLSQSFVPLNRVQVADDHLRAAYDTATIKDAPRFDNDRPLSPQDEDDLHAHYGLHDPATPGAAAGAMTRGAAGDQVRAVPASSRGRLRRFQEPTTGVNEAGGMGRARVCTLCGAYVASDLLGRHDSFHQGLNQPAGDYARHDVLVEEPAVGTVTR